MSRDADVICSADMDANVPLKFFLPNGLRCFSQVRSRARRQRPTCWASSSSAATAIAA